MQVGAREQRRVGKVAPQGSRQFQKFLFELSGIFGLQFVTNLNLKLAKIGLKRATQGPKSTTKKFHKIPEVVFWIQKFQKGVLKNSELYGFEVGPIQISKRSEVGFKGRPRRL